jgi:drug/metabolite transporter (DMT)-like permease
MKQSRSLADICLLLVALVWGATFVLVQNAISFLEPFTFNAIRFFIAGALLAVWLLIFKREQLVFINWKLVSSGIFIGLWLFAGYAFQTAGLLYTTSSKAGFITGLSVVMVPLLAFALLKIKPGGNSVIGVAAAAAGLYLLAMTDASSLNKGDMLTFVCAAGFALHIIFTGKFSKQHPALLLTVVQILTVSGLSGVSAFLFEDWQSALNPDIILEGNVVTALLVTSIFATALAFLAQTAFQKFTTPTRVALIFAMEPVFAAAAGYFWAGDRLTISALAGCGLIFAGMVYAEMPSRKEKRAVDREQKSA